MIKRVARGLVPAPYRYLRKVYLNALNHLRWLALRQETEGRDGQPGNRSTPYTSAYYATWSEWDYLGFADVLNRLFQPTSVTDVGCGTGLLLDALRKGNPQLKTFGWEYSRAALTEARHKGLEVERIDLGKGRLAACLQRARVSPAPFDLVLCFEVAEHLPLWRARGLVRFLAQLGGLVVFSAAQPGQGGIMHLNEQPPTYWTRKFRGRGLACDREFTAALRKELSGLRIPSWYAENSVVLRHEPVHPGH